MVESRRGSGGGEDSHGFIARGGEGSAPIDFIVQTLHAGGQLQQAQSNRGLRKLILDCSICVDVLHGSLPFKEEFGRPASTIFTVIFLYFYSGF